MSLRHLTALELSHVSAGNAGDSTQDLPGIDPAQSASAQAVSSTAVQFTHLFDKASPKLY